MIPKQVTLIPFYLLMSQFGWVDSHLSLIVPAMIVNPFAVFLMRQFVLSLPKELEEAALVDGAGRWRIFWSVILPNLKPGLGALSIIVALDVWNSFLFPLVLLNSPDLFTVPLLLSSFRGQFGSINYGLVMAASADRDDPDADRLRHRPAPHPEQHGRVRPRRALGMVDAA